MKKNILGLILTLSVVSLLFCGCGGQQTETKVLRLAETHNQDHITTQADLEFAKLVEEKSNGTIKIEVHTDGELGSEEEVLNQVYENKLDFARISMSTPSDIDVVEKVELPYIFRDRGHMRRAVKQVAGPAIDLAMADKNGKVLAYFESGARNLYTKKPIEKPEDFEGLRIRTYSTSEFSADFFAMIGANPTPLDFSEIASSLEANTIDGAENNTVSYYTSGHYKYAPNLLKIEYRRIPDMLVMSRSLYNDLSQKEQDIINSAASEAALHQRNNWDDFEKGIEDKLRAEGVNITEPSEELTEFLKQKAEFIYREIPKATNEDEVTLFEQLRGMQ